MAMKKWRLVALLLLGGFLVFLALVHRYLQCARPIGSGPAGPPVARETFAGVWSEQHTLIVDPPPTVFEPECQTPKQMRYANGLCRFLELARRVDPPLSEGALSSGA